VSRMGRELRPGHWTYGWIHGDSAAGESFRYSLVHSIYEKSPVWLLTSSLQLSDSGWRSTDSLWATIDSFRPLYRVGRTSNNGRIEHTYREHEVLIGRTVNGYTSWTVKPLRDSTTDTRNGGIIRMPDIAMAMRGLPLSATWTGSLPLPTETGALLSNIWLNLAVDGEEEVTVPAGRFTCWRLRLAHPGRSAPRYDPTNPEPGLYFWVSQNEQWLIRLGMVNPGKRPSSEVLISASEE
jgi:hypothetical protein